jgi:mRNA interferase MazF
MKPTDIYLGLFPFGGAVGAKIRPVLLLTGPVGPVPEILVAYISSAIPATLLPTDIILDPSLPEHAGTNLKKKSILRLHKLGTLHQSSLKRHMGKISAATWTEVETKLRLLLNL